MAAVSASWSEVADGVFFRQMEPLELNAGLVVGSESCLVLETGADERQGAQLRAWVREVTALPLAVVNSHAHFDHCFGNAEFLPEPRWGHRRMAQWLSDSGEAHRQLIVRAMLATGMDSWAERLSRVQIVAPDHLVDDHAVLELGGGRRVHLLHGGRGHSDHDLVVAVPDASVVFWGDLVEFGVDPEFDDSYPLEWAGTLSRLLDRVEVGLCRLAVPGHGVPGRRDQVEELYQRLELLARRLTEELGSPEVTRQSLASSISGTGFAPESLEQMLNRVLR